MISDSWTFIGYNLKSKTMSLNEAFYIDVSFSQNSCYHSKIHPNVPVQQKESIKKGSKMNTLRRRYFKNVSRHNSEIQSQFKSNHLLRKRYTSSKTDILLSIMLFLRPNLPAKCQHIFHRNPIDKRRPSTPTAKKSKTRSNP